MGASNAAGAGAVAVGRTRVAAGDLEHLAPELRAGEAALASERRPILAWLPDGQGGKTLQELPGRIADPDEVLRREAGSLSYRDLALLREASPALASDAWERLRAAARDLVSSGHYAGAAIEGVDASPLTRALYLEVRADLIQSWSAAGALELLIVDGIAQAYVMRQRWLSLAVSYEAPPDLGHKDRYPDEPLDDYEDRRRAKERREEDESRLPPRLTVAQATDRALEFADKFEKAALRGIRSLRDLRRFSGPMNIQAGQVNIAAGPQQVNVQPSAGAVVVGDGHQR